METLEALACLRSAGMSIDEMRAYLDGIADGDQAAEQEAAAEVLETMRQLRDHDRETRR